VLNESTKTEQPTNENPDGNSSQIRSNQDRLTEEQRLVHREEHLREHQQKSSGIGGRFISILIVFVLGIAATLFFLRLALGGTKG